MLICFILFPSNAENRWILSDPMWSDSMSVCLSLWYDRNQRVQHKHLNATCSAGECSSSYRLHADLNFTYSWRPVFWFHSYSHSVSGLHLCCVLCVSTWSESRAIVSGKLFYLKSTVSCNCFVFCIHWWYRTLIRSRAAWKVVSTSPSTSRSSLNSKSVEAWTPC